MFLSEFDQQLFEIKPNAENSTGKKSAIYSTDVYGSTAYHAKCLEPGCGWESKRYDSIKLAQNAAKKHAEKHFKQGVSEGFDTDTKFNGIVMSMIEGEDGFKLTAKTPNGQKLGFVEFSYDTDGTIRAEELEVYEKHRGRGIAKAMYDYVKSQGFTIARSSEQTPGGAAFWDKNRPGNKVWEQGVAESRQPGEYVYHASYVGDNKAQWLRSLIQRGLQPSKEGYSGLGTYFAYAPDEGYYHVTPEDSMILRVRWADLVKLYGVYPDNPKGIERDDDEIIVPGPVPGNVLELEYFEDEWWDLKSALSAETYHTGNKVIYELNRIKPVEENFADGKVKGKSRPGRVKRAGASCKGSVTDLRAKAKRSGGERGKMYHWCANMKSGKRKTNESVEYSKLQSVLNDFLPLVMQELKLKQVPKI